MSTPTDKRYVNFPLKLLSSTITDPEAGLRDIAAFALVEFSEYCPPEDTLAALVQLSYVVTRRPDEHLPEDVANIVEHYDLSDVDDAWCGADGDGSEFVSTARDMLADIELSKSEEEVVCDWYALRSAGDHFGRCINNHDAIRAGHRRIRRELEGHEAEFGPLVWGSVPAEFFFECLDEGRDIDLLRMVAACRSLIGRHGFTGTTKNSIRVRTVGAKSKAALAGLDDAARLEYDRLGTRYQFDKALSSIDRESRGFITKIGAARRVWLSTQATSHNQLAEWVNEHRRIRKTRQAEAEARKLLS